MLYSNINNICILVYLLNMVYSISYVLVTYAIYHTCFNYIYIAYPEWYITYQNVI